MQPAYQASPNPASLLIVCNKACSSYTVLQESAIHYRSPFSFRQRSPTSPATVEAHVQTVRLRPWFPRRKRSWKPLPRRAPKAYEIQRVRIHTWPCCRCQLPIEAHTPLILRICTERISKLIQSLASFRLNCLVHSFVTASSAPESFDFCSCIPRPNQQRRLGQLLVWQLVLDQRKNVCRVACKSSWQAFLCLNASWETWAKAILPISSSKKF